MDGELVWRLIAALLAVTFLILMGAYVLWPVING